MEPVSEEWTASVDGVGGWFWRQLWRVSNAGTGSGERERASTWEMQKLKKLISRKVFFY